MAWSRTNTQLTEKGCFRPDMFKRKWCNWPIILYHKLLNDTLFWVKTDKAVTALGYQATHIYRPLLPVRRRKGGLTLRRNARELGREHTAWTPGPASSKPESPFHSQAQKVHSPKRVIDVVRIGSVIIFHLSKLQKAKFFKLCGEIFLARPQGKFEIDHSWEWKG